MCGIFGEIEDYLKQNCSLNIKDIIVNYNMSLLFRNHHSFTMSDIYKNGSERIMESECYYGDLTINDKLYRLICDVTLEDDEIKFD